MCMSSTPKVSTPAVQTPDYLHNPFLDGASISGSDFNSGRNSLVNAPGSADYAPTVPGATQPGTVVPTQKTGVATPAGATGLVAGIPTIGGSMAGALPNSVAPVIPTIGK